MEGGKEAKGAAKAYPEEGEIYGIVSRDRNNKKRRKKTKKE